MGRIQSGYIYEASGAFFCRYWTTEIVSGQPQRVQRSHRLCDKTDEHYARNAKAVKLLRDKFMLTVNEQVPGRITKDVTIGDFYEKTYQPFITDNLRASTVFGYEHVWNKYLKDHFGQKTLKEYRTHMGSQFLTSLTKKLGRRSIAHIRSLSSGIFTHAVNVGLIESNPWHDVKVLGKQKAVENTPHYTLEEIENIISALVDRVDCQLIMALAFFLGLRPGEIAGLQWSDVDEDWLHIRRAVVRRIVGETKTAESTTSVPLIQPVKGLLKLWRKKSGKAKGWVFESSRGTPIDLTNLARTTIIPTLEKAKLKWKGYYAGRRGAGTVLTALTGDALAAQQILRHKNLAVTTGFYVKKMPEQGLAGMRLLEQKALAAGSGDSK